MKIVIVAAMAENRVIGIQNRLPWHLPADLRHFKQLTLGKSVIMGRKTFECIGKPLSQRHNIIITRNPAYHVPGADVVGNLAEAIALAHSKSSDPTEICIIGGAEIYTQALPLTNRLHLTLIHQDFEGDAFFPEIDWKNTFRVLEQKTYVSTGGLRYSFVTAERV